MPETVNPQRLVVLKKKKRVKSRSPLKARGKELGGSAGDVKVRSVTFPGVTPKITWKEEMGCSSPVLQQGITLSWRLVLTRLYLPRRGCKVCEPRYRRGGRRLLWSTFFHRSLSRKAVPWAAGCAGHGGVAGGPGAPPQTCGPPPAAPRLLAAPTHPPGAVSAPPSCL